MIYECADIIHDVRVCLDQNGLSGALLGDGDLDTLMLDKLISSKIVEAVRRVHSEAPASLLDCVRHFGDCVEAHADGSGTILLPSDFMRLVSFRMSDWARTVYGATEADSPEGRQQRSPYLFVRGNAERPVCVIDVHGAGLCLSYYSTREKEHRVAQATYMPFPAVDCSGGIEICSRCYEGVVYTCGALVCSAVGEADKMKTLLELSKSLLQ